MTVVHRSSDRLPDPGLEWFTRQVPDASWEQARDGRLAAFVRARLAHVHATGCTEERKWAAGVGDVFEEWDNKRELAARADNDLFTMPISALGWALRCIAHTTWHNAPGWEPAFHPQAASAETVPEPPS
ncbi:hypothetical protein ACFYO5_35365 [Streptomyces sp. NPDC006259]|uniref:hypothetical protein n=1 Tax=Streptomyces sp. NPDC006259 TaxID=3364740 RepID=UPI0036992545